MGRRRKQPRRIVTFNLNESIADEIDDLQLPNRSEWANKVLRDVLDGRQDDLQNKREIRREDLRFEGEEALLESLSTNPHRLAAMLLNALSNTGLSDLKIKGRYTLSEQLRKGLNDGSFRPDFATYDEAVKDLQERLARGDI